MSRRGIPIAALAMMAGFAEQGWSPELAAMKRENEARDLANDPFLPARRRFPEWARLDFRAEAALIRGKRSRCSANERARILRVVEAVERYEEAVRQEAAAREAAKAAI